MKKIVYLLIPVLSISFLVSCGGGNKPAPTQTIERIISFNIPNCKLYYGNEEITSNGLKISVPDVNPYFVKFSLEVDKDVYVKPSDVILDKETEYRFYNDNGDLYINLQSDLSITGACDMYKPLDECSWAAINRAVNDKAASKAFKIGDTKKVQLKHQANNIYQTVRIIGFNHDELSDGTGNAGITFEFADLISDENGYSLATPWNWTEGESSTNYNYFDSNLRKAIDDGGADTTKICWCRKGETSVSTEEPYKKSVYDMLPDDLKADGILKEVKKVVATTESYTADTYNTKLFPLSYSEIDIISKKARHMNFIELAKLI